MCRMSLLPPPACWPVARSVKSAGRVFASPDDMEYQMVTVYVEKSEFQASRAYSPAVITQGGKTVWLAGQTATQDEQGKDISGNFDAQVRAIFGLLDKTLKGA